MTRRRHPDSHISEVINLWLVVLLLGSAIVSVAVLYVVGILPPALNHIANVMDGVAVALLTVALTGVTYEVFLRRHVAREVLAAVNLSRDVERAGIIEFARD